MQNDELQRLAGMVERTATVSPTDVSTTPAPSGFSPQDLAQLRQQMDEEIEASSKSREDLEIEETAWTSEDSLAAAQRFFSSAALGWGDEMGLWVSAAITANITYPYYDIETTTKEQYNQFKKEYDAKQREFAERQQGAAMAADIAGGFASPAMALKAGTTLGRLGLATGEGAVYGAGAAEQGQRIEGAGTGAAGGAIGFGVVKGVTAGVGKGADLVSRRRVEGDLVDADGTFVPITLAASDPKGSEGLIHTFYRDIVSPSFGGKGVIREQEEAIVKKAEDYLESQQAFSKKLDEGIRANQKQSETAMKDAVKAIEAEFKNLADIKKRETADIILPLQEKFKALKAGKAEEIVNRATAETRKVLDARRFDFRNEVFLRAFPEEATGRDIQRVLEKPEIGQRARALDDLWRVKGYSMINKKKFRFKAGELQKNLEQALVKDDYFVTNTVDIPSVMKVFDNAVETTNFFRDKSGRVDGSLVSSLRSRVGTLANEATDPQNRRALYTLQDEIDKIMRSQLTDAQKLALDKERGKWKTTVVLRETIERTQGDPKKRGVFNESDWIQEVGKNNRWDSRYGTGPLNKTARTLEFNLGQAEKSIAKRAANLAKTKARVVEKEITDHRNKLASSLSKIDNNLDMKKKAVSRKPELATEISNDINRKTQLESEIKILNQELDQLKRLRSPQNPSWFHTLAATGMLAGTIAGGVQGAALTAAGAYGLGKTLANPKAQQVIAGQTPTQQSIQSMLQADRTGRTAEILQRAGGVVGSRGMLTGQ
tara:strand:- start:67 stop:2382 length:2316 start_codon:yes stop_codon:yes gene_type:complete